MSSQYATSYDRTTTVTNSYSETQTTSTGGGVVNVSYVKGIPAVLKGLEVVRLITLIHFSLFS